MTRLQSSMGKVYIRNRPDMFMNGYMAVAKVLKVHHASGTADIQLVNNGNVITSNPINEGRFAARILTTSSNFNNASKESWGDVHPIAEGTLCIVAFMENMKAKPIILGFFHMPDNIDNVLTETYPLNEKTPGFNKREALKTLQVFPTQGYNKVDGEGNVEKALPSKSFLRIISTAGDPLGNVTDRHNGFDYQNLTEVDPRTGKVRETTDPNAQQPIRILFVNRRFDLSTGWTKFFQDEYGMTRFTRDNNDGKLTYLTLNADGSFKIRRQLDSNEHESGKQSTEVRVDEDGTVTINRSDANGTSSFVIDTSNNVVMTHESGSFIQIGKDITIHAVGNLYFAGQPG